MEAISYRKSQQPETLTVESVQRSETIEQNRKQTVNNASDLISTINSAQNALKKNFDSVSMKSPEYNQKLNEYVKQSDELKKMYFYENIFLKMSKR